MTDSVSSQPYELSDYLSVLRRKWAMILAWTVIGVLAAAAYLVVGPKAYTATASVYVTTNAANSQGLLGSKTTTVVNMDNEAQIVMSTSVSNHAVRRLDSKLSPIELLRRVTVTVPANTQVLQISCSSPSAKGSAACAEAFANSYLDVRQTTAELKVRSEIQADQAREQALENQLQTVEGNLARLSSGSAGWVAARSKLANISSRLAPLRAAIASFGASNNYQAGYIITRAIKPKAPSSPRKLLFGPSGLMAGLLIGLGLAFVTDRRDDRLHGPADLERFLSLPVLISFGRRPAEFRHAIASPRTPYGRAFTELSRVIGTELGDGDHTILVVGQADSSVIGANLAGALARTQSDVLLVLASSQAGHAPMLARAGADAAPGLAAVVAGDATVSEVTRPFPGIRGLRVITAGGSVGAIDDLPSDESTRMAAQFHVGTRYVVIATEAADGLIGLAEFAGTAIIVAETGTTSRREVADWLRWLGQMHTTVLGAMVLPPSRRSRKADKRAAKRAYQYRVQPGGPHLGGAQREGQRRGPLPYEPGRREPRSHDRAESPAQPQAPESASQQAFSAGSVLEEFRRRQAREQQERDTSEPAARAAGQTWPMPRVLLPDAGAEPGSESSSGYTDAAKDEG